MEGIKLFLQKQLRWLVAVLLVGITCGAVWYFFGQGPPEPGKLLSDAWKKSLAEDSYSFSSKTNLLVDGKTRSISTIEGQIKQADFHITGKIINTPVEVYRIGKVVYLKDVFDGKDWKVFEDGLLQRQALVMAEIDPLSYLQFKNVLEVRLIGLEQLGERAVYKLETDRKSVV